MDYSLIQGAISSIKSASDIAKSILDISKSVDINARVIELQSAILNAQSLALDAQSLQSTMIEQISDLKEEMASVKKWESEKKRYALQAVEPGIFTYSLKKDRARSEPPHWICAGCYQKGSKSILQSDGDFLGETHYICSCCNHKVSVKSDVKPNYA